MWTVEAERRYVDLGINNEGQQIGFWETRHIAKKEDGTTIFMNGVGREGEERFKYQDNEVAFEFWANRCDTDRKLTDTYRIRLYLPTDMPLTKARTVAQNMREALLGLPPEPILHKGQSPRRVIPDWEFWNKTHPGSEVREDLP